ncbi:MAG: hypothetical protein D6705_11725 [Deltaproteobacteria bacterium]|nr:MAG: hypothetical protein D6705_11725 [Deltaproteobacteria bacterium]
MNERHPPRRTRRAPSAAAVAVFTVVLAVLAVGGRDVGITRDEGVYMEAGRRYGAWVARLVRDPRGALADRDRAFAFNWEHPDLLKTAFGVSARLFAQPPVAGADGPHDRGGLVPLLPESAAMRLPAQVIAAFGAALLCFVAARRSSVVAGVVAAGAFVLLPRVHFHAHLAAFDVPVAVAILVVVLCYLRALSDPRALPALAVALGLAIGVKLNALFVGPVLYLHYLAVLARQVLRDGVRLRLGLVFPAWTWAAALGGPLVGLALWPWLWRAPFERFAAFVRFHAAHPWYNMEYFGQNYNLPPLPVSYPFVMTAVTVPATVLVLGIAGLWLGLRDDRRAAAADVPHSGPTFFVPVPDRHGRREGLLYAMSALWPLVLIAWPTVPIFGGTKHWFPAYPFLALGAARAFAALVAGLPPLWRAAAACAALAPAALTTASGHPFGLSQYTALTGGARGAARLGFGRGFWGHAVVPLLGSLPERGRIYPHDLHELARRTYVREGRWPEDLVPAPPARADLALYFPERHMTTHEIDVWNAFGHARPTDVLSLHDVPVCLRYDRGPQDP